MLQKIGIMGCGWLGLPLAQHLISLGFTVKGTTTSIDKIETLKESGIMPFLLDINNLDSTEFNQFLKDLDVLILTIPPIRGEAEPTYAKGFQKIMPFLLNNQVKNVVMMSSVSVYSPDEKPVSESSISYSSEATALQILEAEQVLEKESSINTCILRLGGLFGAGREPVRYICAKEELENPLLSVNMAHLDDILQYTIALLKSDAIDSTIYNIVSPKYKNRLDYYTQRAEICEVSLPKLGGNNWNLERKVEGSKIAVKTGLKYVF